MEKGVYFPQKLGVDKGMILNLLNTDKLGSFIRSDIPGQFVSRQSVSRIIDRVTS